MSQQVQVLPAADGQQQYHLLHLLLLTLLVTLLPAADAAMLLLLLQAFLGGKAACGLTMAAIRCASKAALPGKSMQHLQLGTAVFLAVGALLVALCVFIIGVLLPRLQAGMEAESLPPSKLVPAAAALPHKQANACQTAPNRRHTPPCSRCMVSICSSASSSRISIP
jgi:hypothetical protein